MDLNEIKERSSFKPSEKIDITRLQILKNSKTFGKYNPQTKEVEDTGKNSFDAVLLGKSMSYKAFSEDGKKLILRTDDVKKPSQSLLTNFVVKDGERYEKLSYREMKQKYPDARSTAHIHFTSKDRGGIYNIEVSAGGFRDDPTSVMNFCTQVHKDDLAPVQINARISIVDYEYEYQGNKGTSTTLKLVRLSVDEDAVSPEIIETFKKWDNYMNLSEQAYKNRQDGLQVNEGEVLTSKPNYPANKIDPEDIPF